MVYEFAVVDAENDSVPAASMQVTRYPVAVLTVSQFKIIVFGVALQSVTTVTDPGGCNILLANVAEGSGQSKYPE